jgi:hypothetical protein
MAVQEHKSKVVKVVKWLLVGGLVIFAVLQVLPLGRDHTNPPITGEPVWITRNAEVIARASCFDCHSNETRWPWYTDVIPWSWLTENDVEQGRAQLNFSEWDRPQPGLATADDTVVDDSMAPWRYLLLHPDARLDDDEKAQLVRALRYMQIRAAAEAG